MKIKVVDLNWCMARIHTDEKNEYTNKLIICQPADEGGGSFTPTPASSVVVYGKGVELLRDALNEELPVTIAVEG